MKVLLYLEGEKFLSRSGIGRALKHQETALSDVGIEWTNNPKDDFDILHLNTYYPLSWFLLRKTQKAGKKAIFHGHSTMEDFRNSFIGSNFAAPFFKWYLTRFYKKADMVITPTKYSASLIRNYGTSCPIIPISNGINLKRYVRSDKKEQAFRDYFHIQANQKVVICAGLYFIRKGIDDFVKVAEQMPDVRFIWFGYQNLWSIPRKVRQIVKKDHPSNVEFPGYIKGDVYEGALTASDCFFFPSREETEGIVVLEAMASHQNVLVRDIPVYKGWLDERSACLATDVSGFTEQLKKILAGKLDKREVAFEIVKGHSLNIVGQQLKKAYEEVLSL
jgi:1,2-diacylglycerol-3-alpha-glucose alpha-1,2-glucosyltransferase